MPAQEITKIPGKMVIISSPSGAGKTTITKSILKNNPDFQLSISVTTRIKRQNETEAKDYFFLTDSEFQQLVEEDLLLEYATVFSNKYGTPRKFVERRPG